jgi:hypothetical protein
MKVEYSSNNSGGVWWLDDSHWTALENGGWKVQWYRDQLDWDGKPYKDGRSLGALACYAEKEFDSIEDAKEDFYNLTGCLPDEEGCSCCGTPHNFYNWGSEEPDDYDDKE